MSVRGSANEIRKHFKNFIQNTALKGQFDAEGGFLGTRKIRGYVANIHDEGELAGTIDVQEFNDDYDEEIEGFDGAGYHEGVKLCATQINGCGVLIVPLMFSEVVIVQNPSNQEEYVIAYSHAHTVQIKSHDSLNFGVIEHEDFNLTEDGLEKDYDELEETGRKATTDYSAELIKDEVSVDGEGLVQEKTAEKKTIAVGDTKITIDGSQVTIETSGNVTFKVGGSTIEEKDGAVNVKTSTANVEGSSVRVKGSNVEITGGVLKTKGISSTDLNGPFNAIKVCPFSGAPHCGSQVSGT